RGRLSTGNGVMSSSAAAALACFAAARLLANAARASTKFGKPSARIRAALLRPKPICRALRAAAGLSAENTICLVKLARGEMQALLGGMRSEKSQYWRAIRAL